MSKQTGDAVSSLAGKYAKLSAVEIRGMTYSQMMDLAEDIRSMAASLLSQDETAGRRGSIAQFFGRFGKPLER
jgi:hypothetical protein